MRWAQLQAEVAILPKVAEEEVASMASIRNNRCKDQDTSPLTLDHLQISHAPAQTCLPTKDRTEISHRSRTRLTRVTEVPFRQTHSWLTRSPARSP